MAGPNSSDAQSSTQSSAGVLTRIYILKDPRDGAVRYVGKTTRPLYVRFWQHTGRASLRRTDTWCARWIRSLLDVGLAPVMEFVEDAAADWAAREAYWIAYYRAAGADLTNLTNGGEGAPGFRMTAAQRARVKEARADPQWREATSARVAALWADPSVKAARAAKVKATKAAPEWRSARSAAAKAEWDDPARRKHLAERTKAQWTPERRAAQAASNAARWADPDWRAATIERMRAKAGSADARLAQAKRSQRMAADAAWRDALSAAQKKAHQMHPERWARTGAALKGRTFSAETIEKMRGAAREREARKRAAREAPAEGD